MEKSENPSLKDDIQEEAEIAEIEKILDQDKSDQLMDANQRSNSEAIVPLNEEIAAKESSESNHSVLGFKIESNDNRPKMVVEDLKEEGKQESEQKVEDEEKVAEVQEQPEVKSK